MVFKVFLLSNIVCRLPFRWPNFDIYNVAKNFPSREICDKSVRKILKSAQSFQFLWKFQGWMHLQLSFGMSVLSNPVFSTSLICFPVIRHISPLMRILEMWIPRMDGTSGPGWQRVPPRKWNQNKKPHRNHFEMYFHFHFLNTLCPRKIHQYLRKMTWKLLSAKRWYFCLISFEREN